MMPLWVEELFLWICLFFVGYYTCHFKLEKRFQKELDLKAAKLLARIEKLQRKIKELQEKS